MHEILTLQLGQRSNYVATHFWNTQVMFSARSAEFKLTRAKESYFTYSVDAESFIDHNIHFRPGIGADGSETFTPRTLIYDLKGGFGSLKQINALYEMEEEEKAGTMPQGLWDGPSAVQSLPRIPQNPYQQSLEKGTASQPLSIESVRYWSDFNRVFYHPRSIVQLSDYDLESTLMPFERWDTGEELFSSLDREHDLLDRDLRPFAEESDQLQGIQIMTTADDAWAGFAARYMDRLSDEFGKISLWVFGIEDAIRAPSKRQMDKDVNSAKMSWELSSLASMFIPVAVPNSGLPSYVRLNSQSQWHNSALLATAIESSTLTSRLKQDQRVFLGDIENEINTNGAQRIAQLRFELLTENFSSLINGEESIGQSEISKMDQALQASSPPRIDLFPAVDRSPFPRGSLFGASDLIRGWSGAEEKSDPVQQRRMSLPITHRHQTPLEFPQLDSFPRIFHIDDQMASSLSVHTSLATSSRIATRLKYLEQAIGKVPGLLDGEDLRNGLDELRSAYEEGWNSGSDEDDDD